MNYQGLIAELSPDSTIPGKQLEAIMTAFPTCWGYAAPVTDKQGKHKLLMASTRIPEGWSAKDIQDMKAELQGTPEMLEYFGKFPDNTSDVCMQPFPLLEDDKGGTTLCLFMEGDFDHWSEQDPADNLSPEYICYRNKISPLINKLETLCGGDVNRIIKELGDPVYQDILQGTFEKRGVIYFLANTGASVMIEGENDKRKDEDWGALSNEVPEVQMVTDTTVEEEQPVVELSLAEKRKLRQQNADKAATKTADTVKHELSAVQRPLNKKPATQLKDTTLAEQGIKVSLKTSTAAAPAAKGPVLIHLPLSIRTVEEALTWWKTNFGTCPNEWKHKQADSTWVPSYKAGFPYEKAAKNSVVRDQYNPDGSPKSSSKGFAALDNLATGNAPVATAVGPHPDAARPPSAANKFPVMPAAVRDKVIAEMVKLDLKGRKIMTNEEVQATQNKHSTFFAQLGNTPVEDLWRMSYEEIDRLNRTYPDFGSVWLFSLRNYQMQNWEPAEPKKEETAEQAVQQPEQELSLAQKRALRKKAAA